MSKEVDLLYKLEKGGVKPTQGYKDDYAYDMYASEGVLVPPSSFKSVKIPTGLQTAFDPTDVGMKVSLRSGVALNTPLIVSNTPGIIEGTYRDGISIMVRNTFIDNTLADFLFTEEGKKMKVSEVPMKILNKARKFHKDEMEMMGYEQLNEETDEMLYKTHVPKGTIYIRKHTRIAQMHMQDKISINFEEKQDLPKSVRGKKGLGSSGTNKK